MANANSDGQRVRGDRGREYANRKSWRQALSYLRYRLTEAEALENRREGLEIFSVSCYDDSRSDGSLSLSDPYGRGSKRSYRDAYLDLSGRLTKSGVFVWQLNAELLRNRDRGYDVQYPLPIGEPCPFCGGKHRVHSRKGYRMPILSTDFEDSNTKAKADDDLD